jgi:hypothetical protein
MGFCCSSQEQLKTELNFNDAEKVVSAKTLQSDGSKPLFIINENQEDESTTHQFTVHQEIETEKIVVDDHLEVHGNLGAQTKKADGPAETIQLK